MAERERCPDCHGHLPTNAPHGLCPACLFQEGLGGTRRGSGPADGAATALYPEETDAEPDLLDNPTASFGAESPFDAPEGKLPETLGKFQVIGRLGTGGQGSALLARDLDLGRLVVLKRYHVAAWADEAFGARRDGQVLSRLRSRYVPLCYGIEHIGGELVLVMEYVPGPNLAEVIRVGLVSPRAAARLIEQIAEGLEAVHACGLIHRDIKPANIVSGEDKLPRLVDFGLAAHVGSSTLTSITGTPDFMAPEQARGQWERIDWRLDIYGLGAVLYALLTGRPPHAGRTREESLEHARRGVVTAPRELNRSLPRDLERIVMKALEADPGRRFASASDLRRALRNRRRLRLYRAAGLAGVASLGIAIACAALLRPPVAPRIDHALLARPQQLIKVDRGGREILLKDAVPLVSGDKLWIECDVPPGWHASAFWFDTEGHLTELSPLKVTRGTAVDRLFYPPDNAVTVAGPPGTELIVVCARPDSPVGQTEVAALLPMGEPMAALPDAEVVRLDGERVSVDHPPEGISRKPGAWSPSTARDALKPIEAARERLVSRLEYIVGVAFTHGVSHDESGGGGESHGATRGSQSVLRKVSP